jgi:transposase
MQVKSKKKYTQEFKDQIVALLELGKSVAEVAQDMEVSKDLVYAWRRKAAQLPQRGSGGAGAVGDQAAPDELRELRVRLADLQLENDILKKAAVILGTKPQSK